MAQDTDILSVPTSDTLPDKEFLANDPNGNPYRVPWSLAKGSLFIHTEKVWGSDTIEDYEFTTVIEGVSDKDLEIMKDPSKYRICLLRFKSLKGKNYRACPKWRILMLPYEIAKRTGKGSSSSILEEDTWWPITGRRVPWFRNGRKLFDAMKFSIRFAPTKNRREFCATRNVKMDVGVAIFQYTGFGGEGWTRISNISYISLFVMKNGGIQVKVNR